MPQSEEQKSVIALHKVLGGERLAIQSYNSSLDQMDDKKVKQLLTAFHDDHKLIIERIKSRLRSLGAEPKAKMRMTALIDKVMMKVAGLIGFGPNDKEIIEKIYNNEAKCLQKIKRVKTSELESQSQKLIDRIKTINSNNIAQIKDLLNKY